MTVSSLATMATGATALPVWPILNALPKPLLMLDCDDRVLLVNLAAEQFFQTSATSLIGRDLGQLLPADNTVPGLVAQVRERGITISEHGLLLEAPKIGARQVSIDLAPVAELPGRVLLLFEERTIARRLDHQLVHRNAARSVTAMAAILAHEVKNPLSGIRGAAQLLEATASQEDRELTRLICDEADRIVALVDRMDLFSDDRPIARNAVNIHEVLDHVGKLAQTGFARGLSLKESYDPSLPPVLGNRDLLIQAFLNLIKNAAEAVSPANGKIVVSTRYHQGYRLTLPGSGSRVELPLMVALQDNGPGIPEDLRGHLFDPFVSTKSGGKGLGLALVAKIVGDHGGVIDFDSEPGRTEFRLMLPAATGHNGAAHNGATT